MLNVYNCCPYFQIRMLAESNDFLPLSNSLLKSPSSSACPLPYFHILGCAAVSQLCQSMTVFADPTD
jgi:hypothetical protein